MAMSRIRSIKVARALTRTRMTRYSRWPTRLTLARTSTAKSLSKPTRRTKNHAWCRSSRATCPTTIIYSWRMNLLTLQKRSKIRELVALTCILACHRPSTASWAWAILRKMKASSWSSLLSKNIDNWLQYGEFTRWSSSKMTCSTASKSSWISR